MKILLFLLFSVNFALAQGIGPAPPSSSATPSGPAGGILSGTYPNPGYASSTGSGATVLANTPTLITPVIGAATGTSLNLSGALSALTINGNTFTTGTGVLTLGAGKTATISNTLTLTATDGSTLAIGTGGTLGSNAYTSTAYAPLASPTFTGTVTIPSPFTLGATSVTSTGTQLNYLNAATGTTGTTSTNVVFSTSPTLVTPILGTPQSGTLTNTTGFPVANLAGAGTGVLTWLTTPSSANLLAAVTDETGTGGLVFANTPTLVTPILGVATATSINGLTLTSSTGTLTITNAKTLTASNTLTLAGTDGSTLNVGTGGTLATAAFVATGTSGATIPLLNGTNTWSGVNTVNLNAAPLPAAPSNTAARVGLADTVTGYSVIDSFAAPGFVFFRRADTTGASPSAVQSGENLGGITWGAYGATGYSNSTATVRANAAQTWTDANQGTKIQFVVTPLNTTAAGAILAASFSASGGFTFGATELTTSASEIGISKITASGVAPGASGAKLAIVCGTNAGTAKLIMTAGTSTTAVTVVDNVGTGVTGC